MYTHKYKHYSYIYVYIYIQNICIYLYFNKIFGYTIYTHTDTYVWQFVCQYGSICIKIVTAYCNFFAYVALILTSKNNAFISYAMKLCCTTYGITKLNLQQQKLKLSQPQLYLN